MGNNQIKSNFKFDKEKTYVERLKIVEKFEQKHSGKIPIILQQSKKNVLRLHCEYFKYLVNKEHNIEYLIDKFKNDHDIYHNEIIYFYINDKIVDDSKTFDELYYLYKDSDGFLKIIFAEESAEQINDRDNDIIPIIITKNNIHNFHSKNENHKYFVNKNYTIGQFISQIRDDFKIESNRGVYISINDKFPGWTQSFEEMYHLYKDKDGFLRIKFCTDQSVA